MKILGIDPGYGKCGWAILAKQGNSKLETRNSKQIRNPNSQNPKKLQATSYKLQEVFLVACDCIETDKKKELPDRLKEVYDGIQYVIKKYHPQELAIEELFWFKNKKTAMAVAQARGVIIAAAVNLNLKISEYTPLQVKQAVVGYGRADKSQIAKMIRIHLNGQEVPKQDDTADAVAVGLTHLQTTKFEARNSSLEHTRDKKSETISKFK